MILWLFVCNRYMEARLERGFNLALAARGDQRQLSRSQDEIQAREEGRFHDGIKHRYEQARRTAEIKEKAKAQKKRALYASE